MKRMRNSSHIIIQDALDNLLGQSQQNIYHLLLYCLVVGITLIYMNNFTFSISLPAFFELILMQQLLSGHPKLFIFFIYIFIDIFLTMLICLILLFLMTIDIHLLLISTRSLNFSFFFHKIIRCTLQFLFSPIFATLNWTHRNGQFDMFHEWSNKETTLKDEKRQQHIQLKKKDKQVKEKKRIREKKSFRIFLFLPYFILYISHLFR